MLLDQAYGALQFHVPEEITERVKKLASIRGVTVEQLLTALLDRYEHSLGISSNKTSRG